MILLKRWLLAACISIVLFACGDKAQDNADEVSASELIPLVRGDIIQSHLEFLADDTLQGRFSFEPGYKIAANYVASQFAQLGLRPAGDDGTYMQNISFLRYTLKQESARMTLTRKGESAELQFEQDFRVFRNESAEQSSFEGDLVFVGYGIDAPELAHDDYRDLDVQGKVVVVVSGAPSSFSKEDKISHATMGKVEAANKNGAAGILLVFKHRPLADGQTIRTAAPARSGLAWIDPSGKAHARAWGLGRMATIEAEAIEPVFAVAGLDVDSILSAAKVGADISASPLPGHVSVSFETEFGIRPSSANVVGILEGSDPDLKDEYVLVTAHLDHLQNYSEEKGGHVRNGAMDNAAGVALILETARLQSLLPTRPKRSIIFAALTAEELGLLGSSYFALFPSVERGSIVANINVDMPALFFDFADVVGFGVEHSSLDVSFSHAAARMSLDVSPDTMPKKNLFRRSDHYSFVKQGIPSVFVMPGFTTTDPAAIDGREIFEDYMQNHYHMASDDKDLDIDYEAAAKFASFLWLFSRDVANSDDRPVWNYDNFYGLEYGGPMALPPADTH